MRRDMNHILQTIRAKLSGLGGMAVEFVGGTLRAKWRQGASISALAAISAALAVPHMYTVEPAALPTALVEATDRVGEIPVEVATKTASTSGRHMGFDTNVYPGDRAMRAWKASERYEWVGYYLPAPCHKDASWAGKRERL